MTEPGKARIFARIALVATLLASLPLVLGLLANYHPAFDSLGHFRVHLAVLVGLGGLVLLTTRHWRHGALSVALGVGALWTTLQAFPSSTPSAQASEGAAERATYKLMQLNLLFNNPAPEKVLSLIGRASPDVILLEEASSEWKPFIALLSARYPYSIVCDSPRRVGGVAIVSRRPFAVDTTPACLDEGMMARATLDLGGQVLDVAALHLLWPWPFEQPAQLDRLVPILGTLGETAILAGDLNATTWSAAVRRVEAAGGLAHLTGIGPTWLTDLLPYALRPYIGLPIDQVMRKGEVAILAVRTLEPAGSDHLPLMVEFQMTGSSNKGTGETVTALAAAALDAAGIR